MKIRVNDYPKEYQVELEAETFEEGRLLLEMAMKSRHEKDVAAVRMWPSNPPRLWIDIAKSKTAKTMIGAWL